MVISLIVETTMLNFLKNTTAFSMGVFVGVVYGSVVASFTAYAILSLGIAP